jgi:glycosyltransferase involved in cell wall biosynthesis
MSSTVTIDRPNSTPATVGPVAVVCVPTFRRPVHLARTLASLAAQRNAPPFVVIVVDNDGANPVGKPVADAMFADGALTGVAVVEPAQGNVEAINRAFSEARARFPQAPYVLMIDDDEIASPDWLAALVATVEAGFDIVGAPVFPRFEASGVDWLAAHPVFSPAHRTTGPVRLIYASGNILIRATWLDRMGQPYFDRRFTYLGGGDSDFFARSSAAGARIAWCQEAIIHETVPANRTRFDWLVKRALRNGAIGLAVESKAAHGLADRAMIAVRTLARLAVAPVYGLWLAIRTGSLRIGLHPVLVSFGRVFSALGLEPEQYRKADGQ